MEDAYSLNDGSRLILYTEDENIMLKIIRGRNTKISTLATDYKLAFNSVMCRRGIYVIYVSDKMELIEIDVINDRRKLLIEDVDITLCRENVSIVELIIMHMKLYKTKLNDYMVQADDYKTKIEYYETQIKKHKTEIDKHDIQIEKYKTEIADYKNQEEKYKSQIENCRSKMREQKDEFEMQYNELYEHANKLQQEGKMWRERYLNSAK